MKEKSENPFFGCRNILNLFNVSESELNFSSMLSKAWDEANTKEKKELFYVVVFSIGSITDRQHHIFGNSEVDGGGKGYRKLFKEALDFIKSKDLKSYDLFISNDLIRQYTCLDNIIDLRVQTKKGTSKIEKVIKRFEKKDIPKIAKYLKFIIDTSNDSQKEIICKFIKLPKRSSKKKIDREGNSQGRRKRQPETLEIMDLKELLLIELSKLMNWEVVKKPGYTNFVGFKNWKQKYNQQHESVLFSSGEINKMDKSQFFDWLNKLPSGMRYNVRRRVLDGNDKPKNKWDKLGKWFLEWENFKEQKQKEERELQVKIDSGTASAEDVVKLQEVKKQAKVTSGGSNIGTVIKDYFSKGCDKLLAEQVFKQAKFDVPVLPIVDFSGSMGRPRGSGNYVDYALFLLTIVLLKNKEKSLKSTFIRFGSKGEFVSDDSIGSSRTNRFMPATETKIDSLIDPSKSLLENVESVKRAYTDMGGTYISSVTECFDKYISIAGESAREEISQYPVLLVITDTDFNNQSSADLSLKELQNKMSIKYGWDGVIVVWSVAKDYNRNRFEDLDNVIYLNGVEISVLNQIFCNINDIDVVDVYQSLLSVYRSNRYAPIKNILDGN